jgi:hypothetical protein
MTQDSLIVKFPTRDQPYELIKIIGDFSELERDFCRVAEIPGLDKALRLREQVFGGRAWNSYELSIDRIHVYLCVDNVERTFGYLTPELDKVYVQFPDGQLIKEQEREPYLKTWLEYFMEPKPRLSLVRKEEDFFAEINPVTLLTRRSLEKLVPRISQLLLCTSKVGRERYKVWEEYNAAGPCEDSSRYFKSWSKFSHVAKEKEKSIWEQINSFLDSIWLGDSESAVK